MGRGYCVLQLVGLPTAITDVSPPINAATDFPPRKNLLTRQQHIGRPSNMTFKIPDGELTIRCDSLRLAAALSPHRLDRLKGPLEVEFALDNRGF